MSPINSFEDLAAELGVHWEQGEWFAIPEKEVVVERGEGHGEAFAREKALKGLSGRRVILGSKSGRPITRVYPRSSNAKGSHAPHFDCTEKCQLSKSGEILFNVPCSVKSSVLSFGDWSCKEKDPAVLSILGVK